MVLGPHIWNMLPVELKRETSYGKFNTILHGRAEGSGVKSIHTLEKSVNKKKNRQSEGLSKIFSV